MKSIQNGKLATLLSSFDEDRMRRFSLYVHSPYFELSNTLVLCFDALAPWYPRFDAPECSLEHLHAAVFSEREYDYHRINNVLSDLYERALQFLVQISLEMEVFERWRVLPRLRQARLDKQFEQQLRKVEKILDENADEDFSHVYRNFVLNEKIWYSVSRNPDARYEYLQQQYESILNFLLTRLSRLATLLVFEEYQASISFSLPMLEQLEDFYHRGHLPDLPVVKAYRYAFLLVRHHRDEEYFALRDLMENGEHRYTDSERSFISMFLNSHVLWTNNEQGRTDLFPHLVEDHKSRLHEMDFLREGVMPYADYFLFVRTACTAADFDWVRELLENYLPMVIDEEKENCRLFTTAAVARAKGNTQEALTAFQQIHFRLPILAIQVRGTTIMLLFELEEYENCLHALDAFRHYIATLKNLAPRIIDAHKDFVSACKKLISVHAKAPSPKRREEAARLREAVEHLPYNTFNTRAWLVEQIRQLC